MVVICNTPYPDNSQYQEYFDYYSYPLSDFQKYAIQAIVDGQHTLVTAHTGSGKTLPAEFAINHFHRLGKKVIYTSPIKALSNQKYHDFTEKYPDISFGLMTGDIKTNPEADVIIMTTEILMNYLFHGHEEGRESSLIQFNIDIAEELGCVVFDEIHYINDNERGHVWEKTILLLPPHVQMVMLSATIDSPQRFAEWCERGYDKQVYLASTEKRVVPLNHYGYLTVGESIFKGVKDDALKKEIRDTTNNLILLQNERGDFQDAGYHKIKKMRDLFENKQVYMKRKHILNNLALFLRDREMLPAIAFVFSRKHVEQCAHEITVPLLEDDSKVPYTISRECESYIRKLPNYREYLALPEYIQLIALLEKGIGIHHSGMIPILREIVELMISKKVIKLLFATESFAIGLDCPIKTAVMTGLTKFDGNDARLLHSHEYIQMAGRAGRRGIDTVGYVVHCSNLFKLPTVNDYRVMLKGKPQALVSKFRTSYQLLLNVVKNAGGSLKGGVNAVVEFAKKSMITTELAKLVSHLRECEDAAKKDLDKKREIVQTIKTPKEVCDEYIELQESLKTAVNKKRKEIDRKLRNIEETYCSFQQDIQYVSGYNRAYNTYVDQMKMRIHQEEYIEASIFVMADILTHRGFIKRSDEEDIELTDLGALAVNIAEVDSLIMSNLVEKTNGFQDYSIKQLVGLLSIFTDVKVPDYLRHSIPVTDDPFLKIELTYIDSLYDTYETIESERAITKTRPRPMWDIVDATVEWCDCETEVSCKAFIQTRLEEKEISIGDYAKSLIKISAISKELVVIAERIGNMEMLQKVSSVDEHILKYIATTQSLYI